MQEMQETLVQYLSWEDALEKEMATHSSILAGKSHGQRSLAGFSLWSHNEFSSVHSLSRIRLSATPWTAARQASLSITNSRSLLRLTSIKSVMPSSHLILCHPLHLLLPILPATGSFPMSQLFAWGGQSTGVSALASFLPKKSQGWSTSEWTG